VASSMSRKPPGLWNRFWAAVTRFCYRQAMSGLDRKTPTGLPRHRDPDAKCDFYWPVAKPSGTGQCMTDGHYLCCGCEEISAKALEERAQ
jgi:hypothetical protein